MTAGHIRYKVKTHFLGTRDGELFAVCSWAGDGTCTMIGEARLKLWKWLAYRLDPGAHGVRNPDGSARYHAILERKTGKSTLDAVMDVDVHGNVTGRIPLWKGVAITFEGAALVVSVDSSVCGSRKSAPGPSDILH